MLPKTNNLGAILLLLLYSVVQGLERCGDAKPFDVKCETNETCVPSSWICDGETDCEDGSDEEATLCEQENARSACQATEFRCTGSRGARSNLCIPFRWRCDGALDCRDGSDEMNCDQVACGVDEFACTNGVQCVPLRMKCDRIIECADGTDETDCVGGDHPACAPGQFQCSDGLCVNMSRNCDGSHDCNDDSDEARCGNTLFNR